MSGFEFRGCIYGSKARMLKAIARTLLARGGTQTSTEMRQALMQTQSVDLVYEAHCEFGLNDGFVWEGGPTHMQIYGYSDDDLARVFDAIRDEIIESSSLVEAQNLRRA